MKKPLLLDLGCGKHKIPEHVGVDCRKLPGVDVVFDLRKKKWPWKTSTVDEIFSCHLLEHFEPAEWVNFFNECWRILKPEGRLIIRTPHHASGRAFGDLDHKWPPISEWFYRSLDPEWREEHQAHLDGPLAFKCAFMATWSYKMHDYFLPKADEVRNYALQWYKEAAEDLVATCIAKKSKKG